MQTRKHLSADGPHDRPSRPPAIEETNMSVRSRKPFVFLLCLLAFGPAACASSGSSAGTGGQPGGHRTSNRIEATELATVSELDVYQAINRLRPAWLRTTQQGQAPVIVVDGSPQTSGPDMLRTFRAADVAALEYMTASDATTRYGTGYSGGAIVVTTRH
jgi:hypothetical protein